MIHIEHNANDLRYLSRYHMNKFETNNCILSKLKGEMFIVKLWIIVHGFWFANENDSKFKQIFPMNLRVYEICWNFETRLFEDENFKNQIFLKILFSEYNICYIDKH
jgi:hypothetical protein